MAENKIPKVFISYSHDSAEHKQWVLQLATRLRNYGIDAVIDQWSLGPGDDLPSFMEKNLAGADRVLMICTDKYVEKANNGAGGVGYEKMIVTADLLRNIDSNKIVPIIRQQGSCEVPVFLKTKLFVDMSANEQMENAFDELARSVHGKPLFIAPPISNNPYAPENSPPAEKAVDGVLEAIKAVVVIFENSSLEALEYKMVRQASSMSRMMFDHYLEEAMDLGLVEWYDRSHHYLSLTRQGKAYALQHKLA